MENRKNMPLTRVLVTNTTWYRYGHMAIIKYKSGDSSFQFVQNNFQKSQIDGIISSQKMAPFAQHFAVHINKGWLTKIIFCYFDWSTYQLGLHNAVFKGSS